MKKETIGLLVIGIFCFSGPLFAQKSVEEKQDGRYQMVMMEGRAIVNVRTPAMVLDRVRGIVWTCQNLQDGKPLWVKADLAKNGDKPLTAKKYLGKMLMWQDADLRMPAMVLDTEEGIVWTCQNIIDSDARWVQMDLNSGAVEGISRQKMAVIKDGDR
ncbi:MAG: hypothetical protein WCI27_10545 [Candidatus Omnitrophota bacterium]